MDRTFCKTIGFLLVATVITFASCKKECTDCNTPTGSVNGNKVFVVCEGSYGNGNADLWMYSPETDSIYQSVIAGNNSGKQLGDVFQSMIKVKDKYFLCINNSDKIIVLNKDLTIVTYITVTKPRYILPVSENKLYISSLYTNKVFILDAENLSITGQIDLPAVNSEGMLLYNQRAYVCTWDTAVNKVYVVNTTTDKLEDSITIAGKAPSEVLLDKDNKLWVLSGNIAKGKSAYWTKIDPATKQIIKSYSFPEKADPIKPVLTNNRDSIYFIEVNYDFKAEHNGIFRMSVYDQQLPSQAFIPAQSGQYFWGLGINPLNGDIYVGDPKGFGQKSSVMIYKTDGTKRRNFEAGVGVGHFYFTD